jgi:hypothetical protein
MYRFCQRICSNVKLLLIISIRICKVSIPLPLNP